MGQKSLIYAFVARGTVVVSEFTEFSGNFNSIALQCLQKLPTANNKFTYNCDGHTFNYLVDDGFMADESVGRQIPMAFLERVKDDFVSRYGGGKAATATANSLNKEFGSKLKEHMQYCVDHPEEISKLSKVKAQVSEVKGVMMENIEKVLDRGEKIELLVDKTENLHQQVSHPLSVGTGLPEHRNKNAEEDVAAKHEDQADCSWNSDSLDPHHSPFGLPRVQLCEFIARYTLLRRPMSIHADQSGSDSEFIASSVPLCLGSTFRKTACRDGLAHLDVFVWAQPTLILMMGSAHQFGPQIKFSSSAQPSIAAELAFPLRVGPKCLRTWEDCFSWRWAQLTGPHIRLIHLGLGLVNWTGPRLGSDPFYLLPLQDVILNLPQISSMVHPERLGCLNFKVL
ncbi:hypothetical protein TEA_006878 [Camellia sinensis var. sinensis]|uniref:Longin domain-containing protein n=1 Tax=Camellia sinensis var. sinensis TaxID=542762 RepID=A0A4S4ELI4_CAMSN|nr:hypothetical protein TEA_006878 [Camellia sinensis var. sinensis]